MTRQEEIDKHNSKVLKEMLGKKQVTAVAKKIVVEDNLKLGTKEIRQAYFKQWYESCKDIYNKERRKKRKENKGKHNGNS